MTHADDADFGALVAPYRRELLVHCYRMLGSLQDAEDALQETLASAWRGLGTFEERSSLRTWLYRIATNRCLNARRSASRRPPTAWDVPGVTPPAPTRNGEVVWLEPFPDSLLPATAAPSTAEARHELTETISLAFVTALQVLPPRQVAVLLLRDVIGFDAHEVAGLLGSSLDSVNSALKRARAGVQRAQRRPNAPPPPRAGSAGEQAIVDRFVQAWEHADIDALVALLTDDVFVSMPPMPFEYEGRELAAEFFGRIIRSGHRFELRPTRANGQPAFGAYLLAADGVRRGVGLYVIELAGDGIAALTRFESHLLGAFGLPRSLPPARTGDA